MNDVQLIREALMRLANNLVRDILMVIAMVGMMLWFDWLLTLVVLVVYPIAMQPILSIGRRQQRQSGALQEQMAGMTALLAETLQSSRMVRAYSLEDHETERTAKGFTRLARSSQTGAWAGPDRPHSRSSRRYCCCRGDRHRRLACGAGGNAGW